MAQAKRIVREAKASKDSLAGNGVCKVAVWRWRVAHRPSARRTQPSSCRRIRHRLARSRSVKEEIADISLATFYVFDKEAVLQTTSYLPAAVVAAAAVVATQQPDVQRDAPWRDALWWGDAVSALPAAEAVAATAACPGELPASVAVTALRSG